MTDTHYGQQDSTAADTTAAATTADAPNFVAEYGLSKLQSGPVIPLYHLDNYTFGTKEQQREKDFNVRDRMERLERVSVAGQRSERRKGGEEGREGE